MNIEILRDYCLHKKGATECFPFDETTLVFKVIDKIFALCNLEGELSVNLKCEPEKAVELRERYTAIKAGYHMNKTHWNTVYADGTLTDTFFCELIDLSYNLVVSKLSKKQKEELAQLISE